MNYDIHLSMSEISASPHHPSFNLLKVKHVAIKVREDVSLKELLLTVERELLGADGADLPVALHVLLETALLKVGREDHFTQRAALVDITPGVKTEAAPGITVSAGVMITGWLSHVSSISRLLCLQAFRGSSAARGLDADHLLVPLRCT